MRFGLFGIPGYFADDHGAAGGRCVISETFMSNIRQSSVGGLVDMHLYKVNSKKDSLRESRYHGISTFLLPAFIIYGLFVLAALMVSLVMSFFNWNVTGKITFAGLANWFSFFDGPGRQTAITTLEVVILSIIIQIPLSVSLGVFVAKNTRYRNILAWVFVLPLLVSPTGIAITFERLFSPQFGGLTPFFQQTWLSSSTLAPIIVTIVFSWRIMPLYIILIQAGVRTIPKEFYEAAKIDGASERQQLFKITLPQIKNTITVVSILCLVGGLTAFDLYYVMTGGGPNGATTTLAVGLYLKAFTDESLGAASVYAVALAALGMLVSGGVARFSGFSSMRSQRA